MYSSKVGLVRETFKMAHSGSLSCLGWDLPGNVAHRMFVVFTATTNTLYKDGQSFDNVLEDHQLKMVSVRLCSERFKYWI